MPFGSAGLIQIVAFCNLYFLILFESVLFDELFSDFRVAPVADVFFLHVDLWLLLVLAWRHLLLHWWDAESLVLLVGLILVWVSRGFRCLGHLLSLIIVSSTTMLSILIALVGSFAHLLDIAIPARIEVVRILNLNDFVALLPTLICKIAGVHCTSMFYMFGLIFYNQILFL